MLDFIAIGLGPFNLSLASLLHAKTSLNYLFFEQKAQFDWHAGMQLPNTVLQVPFMADLVSMVDPTSPFGFLNYLKQQQRLYKFYFLEQAHIPRREYNHYCQWVADQLDSIQYLSTVIAVIPKELGFEVTVEQAGILNRYRCRNLVLGSGNVANLPECLEQVQQQYPERCMHSAAYLNVVEKSDQMLKGNVVVLGSGQSAAEVFQDLFDRQFQHDQMQLPQFNLHWLTRSQGFFPMEYSPLGLEHFSPDYAQHFYRLDASCKQAQLQQQGLLYKGISGKNITAIYEKLYNRSIANTPPATHLHSQSQLVNAIPQLDTRIRLVFEHKLTQQQFYLDADVVVAATGYRTPKFEFLKPLEQWIEQDHQGHWKISQDYRVTYSGYGEIYVQNQEMHSHGVVTPDLGMGAYRAAIIANQLAGFELYEISGQSQCFQHFEPDHNPHVQMIAALDSQKHQHDQSSQPSPHDRTDQNSQPYQPSQHEREKQGKHALASDAKKICMLRDASETQFLKNHSSTVRYEKSI
ncbi:SidA/IucD/PvdA family monooxygenase [Acinetobacter sp. 187]|uniref:SidA/IucD/PvdA family monooxygenase n=1 Tax=Acinetobacter lanii TaxID=2715163 RepID=A0A6G8S595_9GAMM|nr:SidA/IucD/PvdA family monooxygenase [Acinetobacter lanii]NHC02585.1 SidA/IucD/PvdA family monooxygenase [Acinetobacter lanii]QIO09143.1 SidA/IucD/PvdA family monooxygenase [Acinetobacter lanii]